MENQTLGYSITERYQRYEPKDPNPLNVVFLPIMKQNNVDYVTTVTDDAHDVKSIENVVHEKQKQIAAFDDEDPNDKPNIFNIGKNKMANFYIGSVTIVGLYILFRLLHKTK